MGQAVVRLLRARGPGWVHGREDLQGVDGYTLAVVESSLQPLRAEAVLCVVTARATEIVAGLRRRGATLVARGPLGVTETPARSEALDTAPGIRFRTQPSSWRCGCGSGRRAGRSTLATS